MKTVSMNGMATARLCSLYFILFPLLPQSSNAVATSGEGECLVNGVMKEEAKEVEDFEEQKVEVLLKDGGGSEVVKDGGVSKVVKDGGESEVVKDGGVSEVLKDGEVMDGGGSDVGGGDAEEVGKKNDMSVVEGSTEERTSCRSEAKDDTKMAKDDLKLVQRTVRTLYSTNIVNSKC